MEIIDIYSPQPMILPGSTNVEPRKKRRVRAEKVIRNGNKYQVSFNPAEEKRILEFINMPMPGMKVFTIHFVNTNKFIDSSIIETDENGDWSFSTLRENFTLSGGICDEI